MRILWINKISDSESWRTTQIELTKSLRKRGNEVTLVMAKNIGEKKVKNNEEVTYYPTCAHPLLSGLIFGLIVAFYFPLIARKKKFDIIFIDATSVWAPFTFPLRFLGIPMILDIRDLPVGTNNHVSFGIPLFVSKIFMDGLTTITPELEDTLRKNYGLKEEKIDIWPSGVSVDKFVTFNSRNTDNAVDSEKFVIIHHGSHGRARGIENLIRAIGNLDDDLKENIRLLLVGVTEERKKEYFPLCEKLGVVEQVKIYPKVDYKKIPSFIKSADIGIIPLSPDKKCWRVSVPLKTLEYLAMGKPILATSIPFHQRVFEKGECGVLIDSDDPKTISDAKVHV